MVKGTKVILLKKLFIVTNPFYPLGRKPGFASLYVVFKMQTLNHLPVD